MNELKVARGPGWFSVGLSSQQPMHILQFGGDVDLLHADGQAVAASDAGRSVPRQGGVFLLRPVEVEIIPGVPLVPENVRDGDVFGTMEIHWAHNRQVNPLL